MLKCADIFTDMFFSLIGIEHWGFLVFFVCEVLLSYEYEEDIVGGG